MATLVAAVINEWPGVLRRQHERKRSQFSASWTQTVNELTHEIDAVHARSAVLGLAVTPQELRQDNWIRASARPQHPGVILEFDLPNGEHVAFPCDTYYTWQDNVRAIALTLRALRTVERYGVTTRGEQYVGFQALPAGPSSDFDNADQAARWMVAQARGESHDSDGSIARRVLADPDEGKKLYREAARNLHPDSGGSTSGFQRLQEAWGLITDTSGYEQGQA